MKFTFVLTLNGDFDVHRAGCQDIAKTRKSGQHDIIAPTVDLAIEGDIEDMNADFGGGAWTRQQFRVLPCTRNAR